MKLHAIRKYVYILLGSVSLALGVIGIAVPVLPTTPFLLLTSFFYLRSSERLHGWLMNNRILGPYIYSYMTYKAIPGKTKLFTIIFLWSTLTISMIVVPSLHVRIFLAVVGITVTVHLVLLRTLSDEEMKSIEKDLIGRVRY